MTRYTSSSAHTAVMHGFCIAFLVVSAWIALPFGVIPVTLQTLALLAMLLIFPPKLVLASVCIYLAMGLIGLPVFSAFRGGVGVLFGPTGGFLIGFVPAAVAFTCAKRLPEAVRGVIFFAVLYACGCIWFMFVGGLSFATAFVVCVVPFLIPDAIKLLGAIALSRALTPISPNLGHSQQ